MVTKEKPNYLKGLQYILLISILLYFGKALFIPLSIAILISFILYPVCVWLEKKSFKRMTAVAISLLMVTFIFVAILFLLLYQFMSFLSEWSELKQKLFESAEQLSLFLTDTFAISKEEQTQWVKQAMDQSGGSILSFVQDMITSYAYIFVLAILIPIFSALLLYNRRRLIQVVYQLFPVQRRADIHTIFGLTIKAYYNFIKGMLIVYLVVGILNSIGLLLLGVPHAILFGCIAALLTFIPYVGILVGALLPITISWLTYNSIWYPIGVILVFTFVQYLEANVIFPLAVSKKLKINTLATLCAIILGGIIWGIAGMVLFVPFLAIIKLIVDKYPGLKTWSILLGTSKG